MFKSLCNVWPLHVICLYRILTFLLVYYRLWDPKARAYCPLYHRGNYTLNFLWQLHVIIDMNFLRTKLSFILFLSTQQLLYLWLNHFSFFFALDILSALSTLMKKFSTYFCSKHTENAKDCQNKFITSSIASN